MKVVNLFPYRQQAHWQRVRGLQRAAVLVAGVSLVGALGLSQLLQSQWLSRQSELQAQQRMWIEQQAQYRQRLETFEALYALVQTVEPLQQQRHQRQQLLGLLHALATDAESAVVLTRISWQASHLHIDATALNERHVTEWLERLTSLPHVHSIERLSHTAGPSSANRMQALRVRLTLAGATHD